MEIFKQLRRHWASIFVILLSQMSVFAQTNLFSESSVLPSELIGEQASRYNKLTDIAGDSNITLIQVGNLATVQSNGLIRVVLPDQSCDPVYYKVKNIEYHSASDYTWYGEVDTNQVDECRTGNMMVIAQNGERFGYLTLEDRSYSIEDLSGGLQALVEKPHPTEPFEICGTPNDEAEFTSGGDLGAWDRSSGNCDIRVLVLFTDRANSILTNVNNVATTAIAQTNQAFQNSGLAPSTVRVVLAGVENFPGYSESGKEFEGVLHDIRTNTYVATRRNATGADVVVLMVDRRVMQNRLVAGITYLGAGDPSSGFAVVEGSRMHTQGFTFAHELGHILGCRHEPCAAEGAGTNCDDEGPYEHAHTWSYKKMCGCGFLGLETRTVSRRTIMYSQSAGNPDVIQHFSNPNVKYGGKATGITNARHNARKITENACVVANYLNTVNPPLNVLITGLDYGCAGFNGVYYSVVSGPPGPYAYDWRVSLDGGITYSSTPISTTSSCDIVFPNQPGAVIVLLLNVTAGGQSKTTFKTVQVVSPNDNFLCYRSDEWREKEKSGHRNEKLTQNGLIAYPNPSNGELTVEVLIERLENTAVHIDLLNQYGVLIEQLFMGNIGNSSPLRKTFNTVGLLSGNYYIRATLCGEVITTRIVVIK